MSTPSVNLKDIAAAAVEIVAQLKRDAESAADRIKRQGEESARAVTNALATLEEGLGEMSELMLAASHVFVQRFELAAGWNDGGKPAEFSAALETTSSQRIELAGDKFNRGSSPTIKAGKHKAILIIIPEDK